MSSSAEYFSFPNLFAVVRCLRRPYEDSWANMILSVSRVLFISFPWHFCDLNYHSSIKTRKTRAYTLSCNTRRNATTLGRDVTLKVGWGTRDVYTRLRQYKSIKNQWSSVSNWLMFLVPMGTGLELICWCHLLLYLKWAQCIFRHLLRPEHPWDESFRTARETSFAVGCAVQVFAGEFRRDRKPATHVYSAAASRTSNKKI